MAMPKKLYCRCGKLKTKENTSIQQNPDGNLGFRFRCKECDTKAMREKGWDSKTDAELVALMNKHILHAERVEDELYRRRCEHLKTLPHARKSTRQDRKPWGNLCDVGYVSGKDIIVHSSDKEIGDASHGSSAPQRCSDNLAG